MVECSVRREHLNSTSFQCKCIGFLITSLAMEVMFLVALICLFLDNITQKVMNGLE